MSTTHSLPRGQVHSFNPALTQAASGSLHSTVKTACELPAAAASPDETEDYQCASPGCSRRSYSELGLCRKCHAPVFAAITAFYTEALNVVQLLALNGIDQLPENDVTAPNAFYDRCDAFLNDALPHWFSEVKRLARVKLVAQEASRKAKAVKSQRRKRVVVN